MTAPNTTYSGVGLRDVQIFVLNTSGYPNATAADTAYSGVDIGGARSMTINDPEPQQIVHYGDDQVFALDQLPATEPISGSLVVGKDSFAVDAAITGQTTFTVGEAKMFGVGTSEKGSENQVGILAYRQVLDTTDDAQQLRRWAYYLIPVSYLIPQQGSFDANPEERTYTIRPQIASNHLWGTAFSTSTEGFDTAQVLKGITEYKPKILAWNGNDTATEFTLSPSVANDNTAKVTCWVDGTLQTSGGITVATNTVTFTTAPTTDAKVVVFYEVE